MPGALSAEATLPPLNLLRYSKMGALLSGERGAGRRFGCLRPSTFQDQARLLQIPLCQEQHPAAAVPSSSLGSGQIPTCGLISPSALSPLGTHGRRARGQMRFGRGSKPCSMRPLCCFPSAPQQHLPAPELLEGAWRGSLPHEPGAGGVPQRTNRARWKRLQDGRATPEQQLPHGHGTVTLLRWPGQLHGSWTGSLGQEPVLCCQGLHK